MLIMKPTLLATALLLTASNVVVAQQKKSAPQAALDAGQACRIVQSAPWVKRQAEWFDDAAHTWSNDTLRSALLAATGLTAPLKAPVQMGVQLAGKSRPLGAGADTMIQQLKKLAATRGSTWP